MGLADEELITGQPAPGGVLAGVIKSPVLELGEEFPKEMAGREHKNLAVELSLLSA
jgi:hypothetical protein